MHLPGALHIADCLLITAKFKDIELDMLQLNKLCYLVDGFTLQERQEPAFNSDIEAWKYGPVIPSIYQSFKYFGEEKIDQLELCRTMLDNREKIQSRYNNLVKIIGDHVAAIISGVVNEYGKLTGGQLVGMTHMKDTPWSKNYRAGRNNAIPTKDIRNFYRNLDSTVVCR